MYYCHSSLKRIELSFTGATVHFFMWMVAFVVISICLVQALEYYGWLRKNSHQADFFLNFQVSQNIETYQHIKSEIM